MIRVEMIMRREEWIMKRRDDNEEIRVEIIWERIGEKRVERIVERKERRG